jgi:pimeloyl-[acyl-carrier protein] methyl ester esterase
MFSNLYTETTGRGRDLLLIHGWGLHGGAWDSLVPELAREWRVTRVDLPGHGQSRAQPLPAALTELAALVTQSAPGNAVWLGWSLGGLVALQAALDFPEAVQGLILVSTTPRFTTADDWSCAMPPSLLQEFMAELQCDYRSCVQRFLALQVRSGARARETLRQLRAALAARGYPDAGSLAAGLEILHNCDLRDAIQEIELPTLVMAGNYDRLTPPEAGAWLAAKVRGAHLLRFPKAAHAPFLSHPQEFIAGLRDFLNSLQSLPAATRDQHRDLKHG